MLSSTHQLALLSVALALCLPARAQPNDVRESASAAAEPGFETVVVDGLKDPQHLGIARLQKGVDAFKANGSLAPQAALRFMAIDAQPGPTLIALKVETDGQRITIAVDAAGLFDLPRINGDDAVNAELVSNRRRGNLRIRPYVATSGFEGNRRRLGDLRLECAAHWAIRKDDFSLFQKVVVTAVGGACASPNVTSSYPVPRALASAQLIHLERSVAVTIKEAGMAFWPPLHDTSWPDDAIVVLTFADSAPK